MLPLSYGPTKGSIADSTEFPPIRMGLEKHTSNIRSPDHDAAHTFDPKTTQTED